MIYNNTIMLHIWCLLGRGNNCIVKPHYNGHNKLPYGRFYWWAEILHVLNLYGLIIGAQTPSSYLKLVFLALALDELPRRTIARHCT